MKRLILFSVIITSLIGNIHAQSQESKEPDLMLAEIFKMVTLDAKQKEAMYNLYIDYVATMNYAINEVQDKTEAAKLIYNTKEKFNTNFMDLLSDKQKIEYVRNYAYPEIMGKAREMGYDNIEYDLGYAYYKGLGKKQDYKTAVQYFEKGAEKENVACIYMLGICYFHGRGVERDVKQGKYWLEKAADKGVSRAIDIMARNDSKTYGEKEPKLKSSQNNAINSMIPARYSSVANDLNTAGTSLTGHWEGNLVRYDWSGEEIEKEAKLALTINKTGNQIEGLWVENDSLSERINGVLNDSVWVFDNVILYENQRPLEMKTGSFHVIKKDGKDYLVGSLSFYSETVREYTTPHYIVLERKSPASVNTVLKNSQINIAPNPFNEQITVTVNIEKPQKMRIVIYDLSGKRVETSEFLNYNAGTHVVKISTADYPKGSYILRVAGEDINQSFTIVK